MFCLIVCHVSTFRAVLYVFCLIFCDLFSTCSVGLFSTLVPRTMFGMGSVDSLLRLGVAHCFLCVVLTFCHVSVSHIV